MTMAESEKSISTRLYRIFVLSAVVASAGACRVQERGFESDMSPNKSRNEMETTMHMERKWAEPIELPGVPNLYKVSDDLYRGAQPSVEGMRQLEKLGIKTIVNLRFIFSDRGKIKDTGLDYEHIHMTTLYVKNTNVARFLKIVTDHHRTPVFVHCHYGIDRTGIMCAIYRIVVQGWSKDEAIEEMTENDFAFRRVQKNLVDYVHKLDINKISNSIALDE
jgi:protein tyrosine phosphatase (PTP) superfamily phosphohydrolase (DUF442 family)